MKGKDTMKKAAIWMLTVLMGCVALSQAADSKSPAVLFQEALYQEETEGDLDKAMELYQQVIEQAADVERVAARAVYQLGLCHLKKGETEQAAAYFKQVISQYPKQTSVSSKAQKQLNKIVPSESQTDKQVIFTDSFEKGDKTPAGWEKGQSVDGVHYIWDRKNGSDGNSSLCLKKTAQKYFPIAQWTRKVEHTGDAKELAVSAKVRARGVYKAVIDALFLDSSGQWIKHEWVYYFGAKEKGDPPTNHNWLDCSGTVEIPDNTKTIVIGLQMYGPGTVWFDELEAAYINSNINPKALVEDFFKNNFKDITQRKTLQWGNPTTDEDGNISIRYKFEGTIWGKDKYIGDMIFTFDKNGNFVSREEVVDTTTQEGIQRLVGKFFKRNYRDIKNRQTLEWGQFTTHKNSHVSIRYKYEATLRNKDKVINNEIFTFDKDGKFVSVKKVVSPEELATIVEKTVLTISTCAETDPRIKTAMATLKELDDTAVVNEIVKHLDSDENTVRRSAVYVLWQGGFSTIEPAAKKLVNLCSHPEDLTRGMAALTLGQNKVSSSFNSLREMTLNDSSGYARRCAAYGLGLLGNPKAKPILEKAVNDPDKLVQSNARAALKMLELETPAAPENPAKADEMKAESLAAEGWKLWRQRKLPEAEAKFKEAIRNNPENENAWQGLGWAQLNQGKQKNAEDSFKKCVKLNPKNSAALNGLGWIAHGQGNKDMAIKWWEKAVKAQPGATAALNGLTQTYMEMEQYDKAVKYYEMWLKSEPNNQDAKAGLEKAKAQMK